MHVLSIKKYNEQQTAKWKRDWDAAAKAGDRWNCMPQLAFYLFDKTYGFVAFNEKKALWNKTKKGVIKWWDEEAIKTKVRGW